MFVSRPQKAPMAKWLTRWSAKPVFMGSNPIRCSKFWKLGMEHLGDAAESLSHAGHPWPQGRVPTELFAKAWTRGVVTGAAPPTSSKI